MEIKWPSRWQRSIRSTARYARRENFQQLMQHRICVVDGKDDLACVVDACDRQEWLQCDIKQWFGTKNDIGLLWQIHPKTKILLVVKSPTAPEHQQCP